MATFNDDGTARTLTRRYDGSPCADCGPDIVAFAHQQGGNIDMHMSEGCALSLQRSQTQAIAFDLAQITSPQNATRAEPGIPASTMSKNSRMHVATSAVRRLTPIECERLQGFPDNYTQIPWRKKPAEDCPDGPRYKALGNSMAVPVMAWIGQRIAMVEAIEEERAAA